MNYKDTVRYWLTSAKDDYKASCSLFDKGNYMPSLFFAHLYIEKVMKALYVYRHRQQAPFGHNVALLAEKSGITFDEDLWDFLYTITEFNIKTRYPDHKFKIKKRCNKRYTEKILDKTRKTALWLRRQIKL
ncbi:MAG: HEPN domain-containing protein [Candidatus Hydrogenedentota bacterium]